MALALHVDQCNHVVCIFGDNPEKFFALLRTAPRQVEAHLLQNQQNGQNDYRNVQQIRFCR